MSSLRVHVPGPAAFWTLEIGGTPCPGETRVPVAPGPVHVVARLRIPGRAAATLTCDVDVPENAEVDVGYPWP